MKVTLSRSSNRIVLESETPEDTELLGKLAHLGYSESFYVKNPSLHPIKKSSSVTLVSRSIHRPRD